MKNSMENIKARREKLLKIIKRREITNVHELAEVLKVSEMSIRRDCRVLDNMGKIKVSFGKVAYLSGDTDETTQIDAINGKIAEAAMSYIDDNQMIFINSSRTAIKSLDYLEDRRVDVLTNNLRAIDKEINNESSIILSGGELRTGSHILTGDIAQESFRSVRASISLIGCGGLDIENGLTTTNLHEAQINRIIVTNCEKLIVLANYTKINKTTNFTVGKLTDIDVLITDEYADEDYIKQIRELGVRVVQVPVE
ncbi:DeoR/GlpR family DNA-binding transcription regulator [Secundilactobacillus muriivasis]